MTIRAIGAVILALNMVNSTTDTIRVYVDGRRIDVYESSYVENSTSYVPLQETAEELGANVVIWDPNNETMEVEVPGLYLKAVVGDKYIVANNRYIYVPDGVQFKNNRVMVPARALGKAFGSTVLWLQNMRAVYFTGSTEPIEGGESFYDDNDVYWLSRIIYAEARGECLEGKIAVGNVVMNRVKSDEFPNSIESVIFDTSTGIQFTPAQSGSIYNTPDEDCIIAAKLVLDGANTAGDSLYFTSVPASATCWAARNRTVYKRIENQVFYS